MEFKKIGIITLIILLMCSFVMPVYAEEINADELVIKSNNDYKIEAGETVTTGTEFTFIQNDYYYHPEGYEKVMIISNKTLNPVKYFLIYYTGSLTISNAQIRGNLVVKDYYSINEINNVLFRGYPLVNVFRVLSNDYIGSLAAWEINVNDEYTKIYKNQTTPSTLQNHYNEWLEMPCSHIYITEIIEPTCVKGGTVINTCEICYEEIITETAPYGHNYVNGECERCGLEEYKTTIGNWFEKVIEALNPFNWIKASNGTLFFDKAGELINENLKDNKFYTSILSVRDSLIDLFNEDYTSRTGFYELGLTNITLGKTEEIVYIDQGNSIIGPWEQEVGKIKGTIDFGLDNVKVLNFDWYFGRDLGDGKYTKGMKPTIDNLISAFLWVMFVWALYKNMPNWISGELTQIGNLTNEAIYIGSKKVTTKLPTLEEKKKKDTSGMRKFEGTKTFDINPKTNKKGK